MFLKISQNWVKFVIKWDTPGTINVSFEKKRCQSKIWKILTWRVLREMILVYLSLNVMLFKFLFIHKIFLARVSFLMLYIAWQNFAREKWQHKVVKVLHGSVFVLFWNLVFMCKGSQARIYANLDLSLEQRTLYT